MSVARVSIRQALPCPGGLAAGQPSLVEGGSTDRGQQMPGVSQDVPEAR